MDELVGPFVRLWNYIDQLGGYPAQLFFCAVIIMAVIGGLTWFGNRR